LPASDADIWLASAFADYQQIVALERSLQASAPDSHLTGADQERLEAALFAPTSRYLRAVNRLGGRDIPLAEIRADLRSDEWYDISSSKGVIILAQLRKTLGDQCFIKLMDDFGRSHAGRGATTAEFFAAVQKVHGHSLDAQKDAWLGGDPISRLGEDVRARKVTGRFWSVDAFERQLDSCLIVHGTIAETDAQREAAQILQRRLASRWANFRVPIKTDREVTEAELRANHVLLIGRPATNRVTARVADAFPVKFGTSSFALKGRTYAHPHTALAVAGPNPLSPEHSLVVFAGLSAEGTWQCIRRFPESGPVAAEVLLMEANAPVRRLVVPIPVEQAAIGAAVGSH
jgi:hypothetical protein